ncbi:hypothetical protein AAFF_G00112550 [Aldrovandia affinis]|uniref:Uncharacterized protein n=1 Tax=Aldrovandia affinis TaxID=143900 RepID=A0AAD7WB04_9TELE|nr:hypothetical protein AAFF_G00112550 [Aldrovandia affinis]
MGREVESQSKKKMQRQSKQESEIEELEEEQELELEREQEEEEEEEGIAGKETPVTSPVGPERNYCVARCKFLEVLQILNCDIDHRPRKIHPNADALSCQTCLTDPCRHCDLEHEKEQWCLGDAVVVGTIAAPGLLNDLSLDKL